MTGGLPLFAGIAATALGAFGETFTLRRRVNTPIAATARGIYDGRHFAVEDAGAVPASEFQVTLSCRIVDVDPVDTGDAIEIRGQSYTVRDAREDGEGMVVLALELADPGT
jgi:hypothetical protein